MDREKLDSIDKKLLRLLSRDGRMPVAEIAGALKVTDPTVRSRMKRMIRSGVLKIVGLIDPFSIRGVSLAIISLTVENHMQLDEKLEEISRLPMVQWAAVVTGHYDICAQVTVPYEGVDHLYQFLTEELTRIGGIRAFETSVILKAKGNWVKMRPGLDSWVDDA